VLDVLEGTDVVEGTDMLVVADWLDALVVVDSLEVLVVADSLELLVVPVDVLEALASGAPASPPTSNTCEIASSASP
jgi:hypothetical protein